MLWFDRATFLELFERQYLPLKAYLDITLALSVYQDTLLRRIPHAPDIDGQAGDPGPVIRWFGQCGELLLGIEYHVTLPRAQLVLMLPDHASLGYVTLVDMLEQLADSGLRELGPIEWIQGEDWMRRDTEPPSHLLVYDDEGGVRREVYRSRTEALAQAMREWVQTHAHGRAYRVEAA